MQRKDVLGGTEDSYKDNITSSLPSTFPTSLKYLKCFNNKLLIDKFKEEKSHTFLKRLQIIEEEVRIQFCTSNTYSKTY